MGFDFQQLLGQAAAHITGKPAEPQPPAAPKQTPVTAQPLAVPKQTPVTAQPPAAPKVAPVEAQPLAAPKVAPVEAQPLVSPKKLTLSLARLLMTIVERQAAAMGVNAVVAVADAGGNPLSVDCMDDAFIASYDIAVNKAYTAVALKMSTAELAELAAPGGSLYGIQFTNQNRIVIFGGGQPLRIGDGIVGGLGVSGGTAEQDTFLGEFGRRVFDELVK